MRALIIAAKLYLSSSYHALQAKQERPSDCCSNCSTRFLKLKNCFPTGDAVASQTHDESGVGGTSAAGFLDGTLSEH
jgi:hypothetical protein